MSYGAEPLHSQLIVSLPQQVQHGGVGPVNSFSHDLQIYSPLDTESPQQAHFPGNIGEKRLRKLTIIFILPAGILLKQKIF